MFQREARQLVNFLGGERVHCIGAGGRLLICECGFAIRGACYDGSDGTGMTRRQARIDRLQRELPGALHGRMIECTCVPHRIAELAVASWRRWRPSVDETENYGLSEAL